MAIYGLIAFVIYGWVEFEAMAVVVDGIGGLLAFLGIFVTAIIGIRLLKSQSAIVMASFRASLAKGEMNADAVASSLSLLCGAILMLIPGYVTDMMGLLCFVPGLRTIIGSFIASKLNARTMAGMKTPFSSSPFGAGFNDGASSQYTQNLSDAETVQKSGTNSANDDVIEGEFHEKK